MGKVLFFILLFQHTNASARNQKIGYSNHVTDVIPTGNWVGDKPKVTIKQKRIETGIGDKSMNHKNYEFKS